MTVGLLVFSASAHRKVVPRNKAGLLRTWPLLIVILRISSTHFLQRVRVKNSKSGARVFFQDCVILPGALQRLVYLKRSVCVFADFPKRTEEKPQDRVKPLLGPNFRNIERKR